MREKKSYVLDLVVIVVYVVEVHFRKINRTKAVYCSFY